MFLIMSRSILLSMRSISNKVTENTKHTFYVQLLFLFRKSCCLWDNVEKYCTARQATCCIPKATNTHSEYVILIAFSLKLSLHERTSVLCYTHIALRYTHIACLLNSLITAGQTKYYRHLTCLRVMARMYVCMISELLKIKYYPRSIFKRLFFFKNVHIKTATAWISI
jgi:hypothetical protein